MADPQPQVLTLDNIKGGAVSELFSAELSRVLENIDDINTDPKQKRTITLTVSLEPDSNRENVEIKAKCVSKLAGLMTVSTKAFIGKRDGRLVAVENDPLRGGLFDQEQAPRPLAAVAPFNGNPQAKDGQQQ